METSLPQFILVFGLFFLTIIAIVIFWLITKTDKIKELQAALNKMKGSFNELDQQAKLIVKTDLELNKAQEELDKRLAGLDALQKASRLISTTLDENEIFERLQQSLIVDLNFEKNLVLVYDDKKTLNEKVVVGFTPKEVSAIMAQLETNNAIVKDLKEGQTLSSAQIAKQKKETIIDLFNVDHFVISPILTQNGTIGIFFVGNQSDTLTVTVGDEEVISILANQIGQSLENARLFEQVFRSSQALELKVQDRTRELANALEDVQNISKMKSEFISAVSHELRTPLTSIKGYASILMTDKLGAVPEEVKKRLEKINHHSDNLVKLINDLLDIARIESGKAEMQMSAHNVANMVENVHDLLTPQMRDKNIQWAAKIDSNIAPAFVDSSQVERVFINLVSNAIKFTPINGTISVAAKQNDGMIDVAVSDTGIGINEKDLQRLFDEFYRVDNEINQNVKGTGLGLSLAKKIVEAHKGKIWVTSKLGTGTTFHFTLPTEAVKKS